MNTIKQIIDINGVAHDIQGVGYTYDEDLNSIAIGKNTFATGRDQFVFGRMNEMDEDKAEIVGGSDTIIDLGTDVTSLYQGSAYLSGGKMFYCGASINELKEALNIIFNVPEEAIYVDNLPEDTSFFILWLTYHPSDGWRFHLGGRKGTANQWFRASKLAFNGVWKNMGTYNMDPYYELQDYVDYFQNSTDAFQEGITSISTYNRIYNGKPSFFYTLKDQTSNEAEFEQYYKRIRRMTNRNIRTLDWNGNEVLAGSLTADNIITNEIKIGDKTLDSDTLIKLLALISE